MAYTSCARTTGLCVILFLSQAIGYASAQVKPEVLRKPHPGTILEAGNIIKFRDAPPSEKFLFFVGQPGNEIDQLKKGEKIKVQEVQEISVPFGKDIWVKAAKSNGATGWVYYGSENKPVNFINSAKE